MSQEIKQRIIDRLIDAQKQVDHQLRRLSESQWQTVVHGESEWQVADIVRHVTFNERSMNRLIEYIAGGGPGASDDFDIDRYNKRGVEKMQNIEPHELPDQLAAAHDQTLQLVANLPDEAFEMRGRHGGTDREVTVAGIFEIIAIHKLDHMHEIEQAIAGDPRN